MNFASKLASILASLAICLTARAGVTLADDTVTYQGELRLSGSPVSGSADFQFRLFPQSVAGVQIGATVPANGVSVVDGLFTVQIEFIDPAAFDGNERWLDISVRSPAGGGVFTPLTPRQLVSAAPYSIHSFGPWRTVNNGLAYTAGNVGIGTSLPVHALHVTTSIETRALYAVQSSLDPGLVYGVYGETNGPDGVGVYGLHDSSSGIAPGVRGESDSTAANAIGVHGIIDTTAAGSFSAAVRGENRGTGLTGIGVYGSHDGSGWGVYGQTNGLLGRGVFGECTVAGGIGGYFLNNAGTALLADGNENNGSAATLHIVTGSQTMLFDGNEIDTVSTGLFLNNNNAQDVTIAGGGGSVTLAAAGGDVSMGSGFSSGGYFVLNDNGGAPFIDIGDNGVVCHIDDQGMNLFDDLYVEASNETVVTVNRVSDDGTLMSFQQAGTQMGSISVSGVTITYNSFTGSHYAWSDQSLQFGTLVSMTGVNRRAQGGPDAEVVYGIAASAAANDPKCMGAFLDEQDVAQTQDGRNALLVMAVGNGDMWVSESSTGNIQPGDYLISSDIAGCAMKDDPTRFPVGYIVARAGQPVDWASMESPADGTPKRAKVSVFFESFIRDSRGSELAAVVEQQNKKIEVLEAQLRSLQSLADRISQLEARK